MLPLIHMQDDILLVGFKGSSPFEPGYFYCPYIPKYAIKTPFRMRYGVKPLQRPVRTFEDDFRDAMARGWCPKLFREIHTRKDDVYT